MNDLTFLRLRKKYQDLAEYKQCIVIRSDLNLSKGKIAVQASHAAILAYDRSPRSIRSRWMESGQKKVVLGVKSLEELFSLKEMAEKLGIPCAVVVDAGLTEVPPGTVTALGLGPERAELLDRVTGKLKLL